jgi:hypothetical protein
MRFPRRPGRRLSFSGIAVAALVVLLLVSIPVPARASGSSSSLSPRAAAASPWTVTWNNVNVRTAGSVTSALSIDFTQSANVLFNWSTGSTATVTINDARLQMFYFGFAVTTRDQNVNNPVAQSSGQIPLSWTPLSIAYVLEGVYKITASFIAPNGTTMFSESFYVRAAAIAGIVAAIPIVLLAIAIYEIYGLVISGRYAVPARRKEAPAATPPSQTPPGETPPEASSPEEGPPTSGGSS